MDLWSPSDSMIRLVAIAACMAIGSTDTMLLYITMKRALQDTKEARHIGAKLRVSSALLRSGKYIICAPDVTPLISSLAP